MQIVVEMPQRNDVFDVDSYRMDMVVLDMVYDLVIKSTVIVYMQRGSKSVLSRMVYVEINREVVYLDCLQLNTIIRGKIIDEVVEINITIMDLVIGSRLTNYD